MKFAEYIKLIKESEFRFTSPPWEYLINFPFEGYDSFCGMVYAPYIIACNPATISGDTVFVSSRLHVGDVDNEFYFYSTPRELTDVVVSMERMFNHPNNEIHLNIAINNPHVHVSDQERETYIQEVLNLIEQEFRNKINENE